MSQAILYLATMVVAVPIAKRLGLGAVLGYLIAGAVIGPYALGLVGTQESGDALHLAEFGVVMMLFIIGLELQPSLLWKLRMPIFGLGTLQVVLTTVAFTVIGILLGMGWKAALAAGLILSLSSTAIVLQTLQERGLMKSTGGETSFSVLLFQDIAVIPILALFPLLGDTATAESAGSGSAWLQAGKVLGAVTGVVIAGRTIIRPIFRIVANAKLRELFTALALLLVLATALLMQVVGLSPALGAFLAGVVLADSEYRHQLEADIEPFKGLLLGVFFISVGAGIDFALVASAPARIALLVIGIIALKWLVLWAVARTGRLARPDGLLFAFSLAQGGEFAFVLLGFAGQLSVFPPEVSKLLTAGVAISMASAPLLIGAYLKWIVPRLAARSPHRDADTIDDKNNPVIVAGFGRFGQTVSRLLKSSGFGTTILDYDADQVEMLRKFGMKSYYGDASRSDLLHAAGAHQAKLLVIAIDDRKKALEIIQLAKHEFPHLQILARAYDRIHAYEMIHLGVEHVYVETSGSAQLLGQDALQLLGFRANQAFRITQNFRRNNNHSIRELAKVYHEADEATYVNVARNGLEQLEKMLSSDAQELRGDGDAGWDSAPRA